MRRLVVVLVAIVCAACESTPVANVTPLASPTPHTPAAQAVLQQSDVPTGLAPCANAGAFGAYAASLQSSNTQLGLTAAAQWKQLESEGAREAQISLFTADPAACTVELAASGSIKAAASVVVAFGDEGEADRAWQAGVLGFAPPAPGEAPPGITRGTATGLGAASWTYDRGPVRLACWRKSVFVAVVVFTNLDPGVFKVATATVDGHLN